MRWYAVVCASVNVCPRNIVWLLCAVQLFVIAMASDTSQEEYIITVRNNPNANAAETDQRMDTLTKSLHRDMGFEVLRQFRIGKYRSILVQDRGGSLTKLQQAIETARSKTELSAQERVLVDAVGSIEPNRRIHAAAGKMERTPPGGGYNGPVRTPYMQMPNRPHGDYNKELG